MVRNERRRSMSQSDASFFIARSSVDLGSLGRESAKDTLVVITVFICQVRVSRF